MLDHRGRALTLFNACNKSTLHKICEMNWKMQTVDDELVALLDGAAAQLNGFQVLDNVEKMMRQLLMGSRL